MGEQLYALTGRTAEGLKQLLGDGGRIAPRQTSGAEARGVTWVEVTAAAPDADGFYAGKVTTPSGPGWADETVEVLVGGPDADAELVRDCRYLCTRTGNRADGKARFRAMESPKAENLCKSLLVGKGRDSSFLGTVPAGMGKCDNVGPATVRFVWNDAVGESGGWRSNSFTTAAGRTTADLFLDRNGDQRCVLTAAGEARGMTLEGCAGKKIKFTAAGCLFCDSDWVGPCGENKFYVVVECDAPTCAGNLYPPSLDLTFGPVPGDGAVPWFEFSYEKSYWKGVTFDPVTLVLDGERPTFVGAGTDYPADGFLGSGSGFTVGEPWPPSPTVDPTAGSTYWGVGFATKPNGRRIRVVFEVWIFTSGSGTVCFSGGKLWYPEDTTNTFDDAALAPHTYRLSSLGGVSAHASNFLPPSYPFSGSANVPGTSYSEGPDVGFSYTIPVPFTVDGEVPGDGVYEPCPADEPGDLAPVVGPEVGGDLPPPDPKFSFSFP